MFNLLLMNLRMFDGEGGTGGAAAEGSSTGTATQGSQLGEATNNQDATGEAANAAQESFDELIKGKYQKDFHNKTQEIINKRFKESKAIEETYQKLTPAMQLLAERYGVDPNDADALVQAISNDDSYYEDAALEAGMTTEQYRQYKQLELENQAFKQQMQKQERDQKAQQQYNAWLQESEKVKANFPSFDLNQEMQNEKFAQMLKSGIGMEHAYKVLHMDDILGGAMQYTAQQVTQKVVNNIAARNSRPSENGLLNNTSAQTKIDVTKLTKADRQALINKVKNGAAIEL